MLFFINIPSFFIVYRFCLLLYIYLMNLNHLVKLMKELLGFSPRLVWYFYINWRESGTSIVLDFLIIFFPHGFRHSLRSLSSISCFLLYRLWSFKKIFSRYFNFFIVVNEIIFFHDIFWLLILFKKAIDFCLFYFQTL